MTPQGGNTGLSGGSVPEESVVVDLRRLDDLGAVDRDGAHVTAGAGATLEALRVHAEAANLFFPVDHAARMSATIGGTIATNAGGSLAWRHGTARAHVLGMEAVLADGRIIQRLGGLRKDNTGYDLAGLLVGSEGTLGIVTKAVLNLLPAPPHRATALVGVDSLRHALDLFDRLRADCPSLHAIEIFFASGLELVCAHSGLSRPLPGSPDVYLLIECAGRRDPLEELSAALADSSATSVSVVAQSPAQREALWAYRERHNETVAALGPPHKMDVALPLGQLEPFLNALDDVVQEAARGTRTYVFGHLGDGNMHVNVVGPEPTDERVDDAVLRLAVAHGGTISAEHGIGRAKRKWLSLVRSTEELDAMRAIKRALDPQNVLNPGVLLPD